MQKITNLLEKIQVLILENKFKQAITACDQILKINNKDFKQILTSLIYWQRLDFTKNHYPTITKH